MIRRHFTGLMAGVAAMFGRGHKEVQRASLEPKSIPFDTRWMEPNPPKMRRRGRRAPSSASAAYRAHRKVRMRMARESRRRNRTH